MDDIIEKVRNWSTVNGMVQNSPVAIRQEMRKKKELLHSRNQER